MKLTVRDRVFEFLPASIEFSRCLATDLFAKKNNKTLRETLIHPKYARLAPHVLEAYSHLLERGLGDFLLELKRGNDPFYLRFLNSYGDARYCEFRLRDATIVRLKGLYCFSEGATLKYIGKSTDSFGRRINQRYGRIHPKNCYCDGQATNCRLNALIGSCVGEVVLSVCPLVNDDDIELTERALIAQEKPDWNTQLKT